MITRSLASRRLVRKGYVLRSVWSQLFKSWIALSNGINHYPADKYYRKKLLHYPVDSDLSKVEQPGPREYFVCEYVTVQNYSEV